MLELKNQRGKLQLEEDRVDENIYLSLYSSQSNPAICNFMSSSVANHRLYPNLTPAFFSTRLYKLFSSTFLLSMHLFILAIFPTGTIRES